MATCLLYDGRIDMEEAFLHPKGLNCCPPYSANWLYILWQCWCNRTHPQSVLGLARNKQNLLKTIWPFSSTKPPNVQSPHPRHKFHKIRCTDWSHWTRRSQLLCSQVDRVASPYSCGLLLQVGRFPSRLYWVDSFWLDNLAPPERQLFK